METKIRVVLVQPEGEINVGSVARLVKNFDADELYLVDPVAMITDKTREFAAKAIDVLDKIIVVKTLYDALQGVEFSACTSAIVGGEKDVLRHPITPWQLVELVRNKERIAVVFGRESVGLTREEISQCDVLVSIPANPIYPTLNLSHAVAIILYELYKGLKHSVERGGLYKPASRETIDLILKYFKSIVDKLERDERRKEKVYVSFKRIINKSNPSDAEAHNILYIMRKISLMAEKVARNNCDN